MESWLLPISSYEQTGLDTTDPLFRTLAWQLVYSVPETATYIASAVRANPLLPTKSLREQIDYLIVGPFEKALRGNRLYKNVVVIDGIGECGDEQAQRILKFITDRLVGRVPLRFLISNRMEAHIAKISLVMKPFIRFVELDNDPETREDVRRYLEDELARIDPGHALTTPQWLKYLVRSPLKWKPHQYLFLCAASVIMFIEDAHDRLWSVDLGGATDLSTPRAMLDRLYAFILSSLCDDKSTMVLLWHVATMPRPSVRLLSRRLAIIDAELNAILRSLHPLLYVSGGKVEAYHICFLEFLRDKNRAGKYYVNPTLGTRLTRLVASAYSAYARVSRSPSPSSRFKPQTRPTSPHNTQSLSALLASTGSSTGKVATGVHTQRDSAGLPSLPPGQTNNGTLLKPQGLEYGESGVRVPEDKEEEYRLGSSSGGGVEGPVVSAENALEGEKKKNVNGRDDSDNSVVNRELGNKRFGGMGSSRGGGTEGRVVSAEHALEDKEDDDAEDKKKKNVDGWSDSDSDTDMDLGAFRLGFNWLGASSLRYAGARGSTTSPMYEFGGGGGGSGGGWGALGLGRLGARFLPDGGARGAGISVPSQMELERDFGEEEEDEEYPFDQEPEPLAPGSYRALYVFEAVGDAEMGLGEGQIVTVTGKGRGDGWAVVHDTREGKRGGLALVPESYLELVQLASDGDDQGQNPIQPSNTSTPTAPAKGTIQYQHAQSSSPAVASAFKTPASSFTEISNPPSPSLTSTRSVTSAFNTPASSFTVISNPPSPLLISTCSVTSAFNTPASSFTETSNPPSPSTRPAPLSPVVSRHSSELSLMQQSQSRRQSGLATEVMPSPIDVGNQTKPSKTSTPTAFATEASSSSTTTAAMPAFATPTPVLHNSAYTAAAETVLTPATLARVAGDDEPLIIVRDYGFAPTDDRFYGRGPFVPEWNKLSRLNRILAGGKQKAKEKEKKRNVPATLAKVAGDDEPLIIVRDYGFAPTDDRFHGRGPFVPKWNELSRLNRILAGRASESDSDAGGKQKAKEKRTMMNVDGWSDSDSDDRTFNRLGSSFLRDAGVGGMMSFPSQIKLERNFSQLDDSRDSDGEEEEDEEYPFDQEPELLAPGLYRALYVFEAVGDAEMGLEEGQIVTVTGKGRGDGWAVVHDTREGKEGGLALVPESYLELVLGA